MDKKIENILFFSAVSIKPPKEGLEDILESLPVTNDEETRYTSVMGMRLAFPIGIIAIMLALFLVFGKKTTNKPPQVITLPATVNKENVDSSLQQVDTTINGTMDDMDNSLNELDKDSESSEDLNDL